MNRNHVDFATHSLPATEELLAIKALMYARETGDASIVHGRVFWVHKTQDEDDVARKLLTLIMRQSQTAPWAAVDMLTDASGALRSRHTHIAVYLGISEAKVRDAIANERSNLERTEAIIERIENLHGNSVLGQYLTMSQACALAEILGRPIDEGAEPFEAYFASITKVDKKVAGTETKRNALDALQAENALGNGQAPTPLPNLRSRLMSRLKGIGHGPTE